MSIEHTCRACGQEYDTRQGMCPACGAVPMSGVLRFGISTLLATYDEVRGAGRGFTRKEKSNVSAVRRWHKKGVLFVPGEEES